jgi:cytidylate kinase
MDNVLKIAIDGPSASGKSTVSRRIAADLGFTYVDSGAFYRGVTWAALERGVDVHDAKAVAALVRDFNFVTTVENGVAWFTVDGADPGEAIRGEGVRESVSYVARVPEVRTFMVEQLRNIAQKGSLVMEGRDIGSVVFPDSRFKFYLDADPEERARRRNAEIQVMEGTSSVGDVMNSLQKRDELDSKRKTAPLQVADGARVVNTTGMGIDEVVATILGTIRSEHV